MIFSSNKNLHPSSFRGIYRVSRSTLRTIYKPTYFSTTRSSSSEIVRYPRLDCAYRYSSRYPVLENQERSRKAAKLPSIDWCFGFDGHTKPDLQRRRRSDGTLCASKVSLPFDGLRSILGSCDDFRLYKDARTRGSIQNKRANSSNCQAAWFNRSHYCDERYYRPRGSHSIPERSGPHVKVCKPRSVLYWETRRKVYQHQEQPKGISEDRKRIASQFSSLCRGKEAKEKVAKKMYHVVEDIHQEIKSLLETGYRLVSKAGKELTRLSEVMETLLPQICHFIDTGFVAAGKIIHLQMPELYSIVRGKAGRKVEFGLKWGINRVGGGFLAGFSATGRCR